MKLSKIYFIWICPEMKAFEWFTGLLKVFLSNLQILPKEKKISKKDEKFQKNEEQLAEIGETNLIEARVYLSRGWDDATARKIMMKEMLAEQRGALFDPVTGLREPTHYG